MRPALHAGARSSEAFCAIVFASLFMFPAQDCDRTSARHVAAEPVMPFVAVAEVNLEPTPEREPEAETIDAAAAADMPPASEFETASAAPVDEVKRYLWNVYLRTGTKFDSHGDFTWKDASAAARFGRSVEDYVVGGMDPDFREQLFAAGHAMDAAGIEWTILSGFRDDYRQALASGYKAQVGNSFHGGSAATGGYGHGCAVDLGSTDPLTNAVVWDWLDRYGEQFGLRRPLRRIDPAHVQPIAGWRERAAALRNGQSGAPTVLVTARADGDPSEQGSPTSADYSTDGLSAEQFNCVRPRPEGEPDKATQAFRRLNALVTHASLSGGEKNHSKAKWHAGGGDAKHASERHPPASDNSTGRAKRKAGLHPPGPHRPLRDSA